MLQLQKLIWEGYEVFVSVTKQQILNHLHRITVLSYISNYFQSPGQFLFYFIYFLQDSYTRMCSSPSAVLAESKSVVGRNGNTFQTEADH